MVVICFPVLVLVFFVSSSWFLRRVLQVQVQVLLVAVSTRVVVVGGSGGGGGYIRFLPPLSLLLLHLLFLA